MPIDGPELEERVDQLEQMARWVGGGVVLIGATAGAAVGGWGETAWVIGLFTLLGQITFHYMHSQLNLYAQKEVNYGIVHPLTKILYSMMPLDINLMLIGAVTQRV